LKAVMIREPTLNSQGNQGRFFVLLFSRLMCGFTCLNSFGRDHRIFRLQKQYCIIS
jgi:hypothetical protein